MKIAICLPLRIENKTHLQEVILSIKKNLEDLENFDLYININNTKKTLMKKFLILFKNEIFSKQNKVYIFTDISSGGKAVALNKLFNKVIKNSKDRKYKIVIQINDNFRIEKNGLKKFAKYISKVKIGGIRLKPFNTIKLKKYKTNLAEMAVINFEHFTRKDVSRIRGKCFGFTINALIKFIKDTKGIPDIHADDGFLDQYVKYTFKKRKDNYVCKNITGYYMLPNSLDGILKRIERYHIAYFELFDVCKNQFNKNNLTEFLENKIKSSNMGLFENYKKLLEKIKKRKSKKYQIIKINKEYKKELEKIKKYWLDKKIQNNKELPKIEDMLLNIELNISNKNIKKETLNLINSILFKIGIYNKKNNTYTGSRWQRDGKIDLKVLFNK